MTTLKVGDRALYRAGRDEIHGVVQGLASGTETSYPRATPEGGRAYNAAGGVDWVTVYEETEHVRLLCDNGHIISASSYLFIPEDEA